MKGTRIPGAVVLSCSILFGQASRPGAFEARILEALGSDQARQRAAAEFVLGRMGDARHTVALAPLLHDPDLAVRVQVVRALDCWPSLEAGKLLVEATLDTHNDVRIEALRALRPDFVVVPRDELEACLASENGMVRSAACLAAGRLGFRGDPQQLIADWEGRTVGNLQWLSEAFWWLDDACHLPFLLKLESFGFSYASYRAAQQIARLTPRDVPEFFAELLPDAHRLKPHDTYLREANDELLALLHGPCTRITTEEWGRARHRARRLVIAVESLDARDRRAVPPDVIVPDQIGGAWYSAALEPRIQHLRNALAPRVAMTPLASNAAWTICATDSPEVIEMFRRPPAASESRLGSVLVLELAALLGQGHALQRLASDDLVVVVGSWCVPSFANLLGEAPAHGGIWRSKERPNVHFALVFDPWTDIPPTLGLDLASLR